MVNTPDKCYLVNRYNNSYTDDWLPLEDMVKMTIYHFGFLPKLYNLSEIMRKILTISNWERSMKYAFRIFQNFQK